jgi:type IV pilus assembly protein PilY1
LPDTVNYSNSSTATSVYWNRTSGSATTPTLSDLAFYYWAKDLQPTLDNNLPAYWSGASYTDPTKAPATDYFNPSNDPATWQHIDMYAVGLGVNGTLSQNTATLNSLIAGTTTWPKVKDTSSVSDGTGIDDTWHAALNSRGLYFSATSPSQLTAQLGSILSNISTQTAPPATGALNTSVLIANALGFNTGFNLGSWSGTFTASFLNADGTVKGSAWDAGGLLTARTASRQILTSKANAGGTGVTGTPFEWGNLDAAEVTSLGTPGSTGTGDSAQTRLAWLRGDRTSENNGVMRTRTELLGAVINAQPVYVAYPVSGYSNNNWPANSPEALAAVATTPHGYDQFVQTYNTRTPTVYIAANDGMLHAFDATQNADGTKTSTSGKELWAYVPRAVYPNLGALTLLKNFKPVSGVDATPATRDVFFPNAGGTDGSWHTILVGGLRLGGRGVYALDITNPSTVNEGTASSSVLWEFNADMLPVASGAAPAPAAPGTNPGGKPADLGYTFGQPNIGRLANGRWVVLVPGGYFPDCKASDAPVGCSTNPTYNSFSSLFVLDAQTGALINELKTPATIGTTPITSYGLSTPVLGDYNNDQVDDVAFAGDLLGQLWRYDLTNPDPSLWTVTLAYKPATAYAQPITLMPRLFPDPATNKFIVVFGTGKYLGAYDNTVGNQQQQSVYGIRDLGTTVVGTTNLQQQTLSDFASTSGSTSGETLRGVTNNTVSSSQSGWYFNLIDTGERMVVTPTALFDTNRVVITTLIPQSDDPCAADDTGAVMVVNAATGGADGGLSSLGGGWTSGGVSYQPVGALVNNPPTGGTLPVATSVGGGRLLIPGLSLAGGGSLSIDDAIWRRRSWRELNNDQ